MWQETDLVLLHRRSFLQWFISDGEILSIPHVDKYVVEASIGGIFIVRIALEAHGSIVLVVDVLVFAFAFPVVGSGDAVLVSLFHDLCRKIQKLSQGGIPVLGAGELTSLEVLHCLHELGEILFRILHRDILSLEVLLRYY